MNCCTHPCFRSDLSTSYCNAWIFKPFLVPFRIYMDFNIVGTEMAIPIYCPTLFICQAEDFETNGLADGFETNS